MVWRKTDVMKERVKFLLEWEQQWQQGEGRVVMAPLCRAFGITRQTGYVWVRRYEELGHNLIAAEELSRKPRRSPQTIAAKVIERVVSAWRRFPHWGPKKVRAWLISHYPGQTWPAASTIGRILTARHLTKPRKRRRVKVPPYTQPFAKCTAPNMTWCVDFKGHFRTKNGVRVYPLTITDAYSRYLIRCSIVLNRKSSPEHA
jgi:putative transposase